MDPKPNPPKQVRVVVYVDARQYQKLKSKLALSGKSVSAWLREKVGNAIA